jgi:hypothetical protein
MDSNDFDNRKQAIINIVILDQSGDVLFGKFIQTG